MIPRKNYWFLQIDFVNIWFYRLDFMEIKFSRCYTENNENIMKEVMGKFAKSLCQGQTLYKVYALGKASYITKMIVQSRVMIADTGYSYIIVTYSLNDNFVDKSYL